MTVQANLPHIGLVVEGAGEREAIPLLLRNYMTSQSDFADVIAKPVPVHGKGNASREGGLEGYVAVAAARPGCVGIMCFFDADDDCAASVGREWRKRASAVARVPVTVALAEPNYEQWLYASSETLKLGLTYDSSARGLTAIKRALRPIKYVKPVWQPRLTARMDFEVAVSRSRSLERALERFTDLRATIP